MTFEILSVDEEEFSEEEFSEEESSDEEEISEEINNIQLLIEHILNNIKAQVRPSYRDMSNDEFKDMIENNNSDNIDDDYKPPFSDGLNACENFHPHCPTILYMYKVYNLETDTKYLKVGIARIPEKHSCFNYMTDKRERIRIQSTEEWYVLWDRENAKKYVNSTLNKRIQNEKNSLKDSRNYKFNNYNYKYVKFYPTFKAAAKNEKIIIDMIKNINNVMPSPAIYNRQNSRKREFFNHPNTLELNDNENKIWTQIKRKFQ